MAFFENGADTPIKDEKNSMSDLMYMITPDQFSSACDTPDEDESTSGASTTNDDGGTPLSLPTDESIANGSMPNFGSGKNINCMLTSPTVSKSSRRAAAAAAAAQHSLLPNGKKTKGRVKIKMEFIDNKLRRYTTFSKRKTGIMKKAYELSTLTGTQVMLLVASETGHVYTFATKKLQPMITSDAGKALIQTCLNSPDSGDGPPHFGESTALSANFHTSEIASLTPASLLFASGVPANNSGTNVNPSQQQRQSSNNNSTKRSQKSHQLQQQHCANAIQDVLAAAAQSRAGGSVGKIDNGDLSILNDLGVSNMKGAKGSYYNASELPTMVPPNSSGRFAMDSATPDIFPQAAESIIGDEDEIDLENGDLLSASLGTGESKDHYGSDSGKMVNGGAKRRQVFHKHGSSPSSSASSVAVNMASTTTPAGSTLNNLIHNIVASRQQQRQQAASTAGGVAQHPNQTNSNQPLQHQNRRKRPHGNSGSQFSGNKHANICGQTSTASGSHQAPNSGTSTSLAVGSQLFPFAGLLPTAAAMNAASGVQGGNQSAAFGLFPGLANGTFFFPPGFLYTPPTSGLPEGAAAALALQQMLASALTANSNSNAHPQSQVANGRNSSPAVQAQQQHPLIPLSLPLSMMTANYLAAQQSQREMQSEDFDDGGQGRLDDDESE